MADSAGVYHRKKPKKVGCVTMAYSQDGWHFTYPAEPEQVAPWCLRVCVSFSPHSGEGVWQKDLCCCQNVRPPMCVDHVWPRRSGYDSSQIPSWRVRLGYDAASYRYVLCACGTQTLVCGNPASCGGAQATQHRLDVKCRTHVCYRYKEYLGCP